MNLWLIAATILALAIVPLVVLAARARALPGLVALELAGVLAALDLLLLSEGFHRQSFSDLALVLGVMSFIGSLTYVRFLREAR